MLKYQFLSLILFFGAATVYITAYTTYLLLFCGSQYLILIYFNDINHTETGTNSSQWYCKTLKISHLVWKNTYWVEFHANSRMTFDIMKSFVFA